MFKETKEWLYLIGGLLLLAPGLFYFFSSPVSQQLIIKDPAAAQNFQIVTDKDQASHFTLKVMAETTRGYSIQISFLPKKRKTTGISAPGQVNTAGHAKSPQQTVQIPAGKVQAAFTFDFPGEPKSSRVQIDYVPDAFTKGNIKLETEIL